MSAGVAEEVCSALQVPELEVREPWSGTGQVVWWAGGKGKLEKLGGALTFEFGMGGKFLPPGN